MGTLRFFREKLQRRNVTVDVKHFEDCEQLFLSIGRCFTIEALLNFFNMETTVGHPTRNRPPYHVLDVGDNKKVYYESVLDKFIDEFLIIPATDTQADAEEECSCDDDDFIRNYSMCLLKYFFVYSDLKDAVKEGNGARLGTLHKQLLPFFKSLPGFNSYALEMFINIVQNEVFLSEAESNQCMWAATANWKGGPGKNIEIDILQENRNKDIKKDIKEMGANKTDKAIDRASRAAGGQRKILENFDQQVSKGVQHTSHSHKSSVTDEGKVLKDLRDLKPFTAVPNRTHDSFPDIMDDPLSSLNEEEFNKWVARHKNLLLDAPFEDEAEDDEP